MDGMLRTRITVEPFMGIVDRVNFTITVEKGCIGGEKCFLV